MASSSITFNNYAYGFHITKRETLYETISKIVTSSPLTAVQLYISNSRDSTSLPKCDVDDILETRSLLADHSIYGVVHSKLLHNPAGATDRHDPKYAYQLQLTRRGLLAELDVCAGLGIGVVVHIGNAKDKDHGYTTIAETIGVCLTTSTEYSKKLSKALGISEREFIRSRKLILENASGEGNKLGSTLPEIATILGRVDKALLPQVRVCIDTAHAYGAGQYDWGIPSEVERFYKDFDDLIGLEYLEVFHLNDSRKSSRKADNAFFGSKKDRHENLGLGYIFGRDTDEVVDVVRIPGDAPDKELMELFDFNHSRSLGLRKFFELAYIHFKKIIGEPPAKTECKDTGLGGRRDWRYVEMLLRGTEYALTDVV